MQKPTHRNFNRRTKRYAHPVNAKVGDRFPLSIKKLGVEGQGIGYFKHKVCFVPGALLGGYVIGATETFVASIGFSMLRDAVVFALLLGPRLAAHPGVARRALSR